MDAQISGRQAVIRPRGTVPDRILGAVGWAMILAAVVFLLRGGERDGSAPPIPPPPIEIVEPVQGAALDGPFAIVFRVPGVELSRMADGWGVAGMHLHILVDGGSFMPAPTDIVRLPDGSYRWSVRALDPGPHDIRLYWSDVRHAPLRDGGSGVLKVEGKAY